MKRRMKSLGLFLTAVGIVLIGWYGGQLKEARANSNTDPVWMHQSGQMKCRMNSRLAACYTTANGYGVILTLGDVEVYNAVAKRVVFHRSLRRG